MSDNNVAAISADAPRADLIAIQERIVVRVGRVDWHGLRACRERVGLGA